MTHTPTGVKRDHTSFKDGRLFVSATRIQKYEACPRSWWLGEIQGFRQPTTYSMAYGTALHATVERWLLGDANTDEGLAIYPEGWHRVVCAVTKRSISLSPADQSHIRTLLEMAVRQGVLYRTPNQKVEHDFMLPLDDWLGLPVTLQGQIDLLHVDADSILVTDHKTSADRQWFKHARQLRVDTQMLTYAAAAAYFFWGEFKGREITLRHTHWAKKETHVGEAKVSVPMVEVLAQFEKLLEVAREMYAVATSGAINWNEVEGFREKGVCAKYGGCPLLQVCGGAQHFTDFEAAYVRDLDPLRRALSQGPASSISYPGQQHEVPTAQNIFQPRN